MFRDRKGKEVNKKRKRIIITYYLKCFHFFIINISYKVKFVLVFFLEEVQFSNTFQYNQLKIRQFHPYSVY